MAHRGEWLKKVEDSHRGPRVLMESENPLSDVLVREEPIWLGRSVGLDSQHVHPPGDEYRGFEV